MKLIVSEKGTMKQVAKVPEKLVEAFQTWLKGDVAPTSNYVRFNDKGHPFIAAVPLPGYRWIHRRQIKTHVKGAA